MKIKNFSNRERYFVYLAVCLLSISLVLTGTHFHEESEGHESCTICLSVGDLSNGTSTSQAITTLFLSLAIPSLYSAPTSKIIPHSHYSRGPPLFQTYFSVA